MDSLLHELVLSFKFDSNNGSHQVRSHYHRSVRQDRRFRLALGSFVEEYNNKVQIVSLDEETSEFSAKSTFDHPYPTTKIMWIPDSKGIYPDLLATSGDYLRVWRAGEPETRLECLLNNNKNSDFCAPLTSFDWFVQSFCYKYDCQSYLRNPISGTKWIPISLALPPSTPPVPSGDWRRVRWWEE